MRYHELRKKEVDKIKNLLLNVYGFKMPKSWLLYYLGKNKVWVLKEDFFDLTISKLNVEVMGFYLCHYERNIFRLSILGAQLVGKTATDNVLDISLKDAWNLIRGFDIDKVTNLSATYIILRSPIGIIGVGKNHKIKVLCQIKKNRRVRNLNK
jgi:NOL1/NOP2/fmu family ribosome biogenesis protein